MDCLGSARELFDSVRDASRELWRHDATYNSMERRALALGGGNLPVRNGSIADRTQLIDDMVDYESKMQQWVDSWTDLVDYGESVLYGSDWDHGIAKSLGVAYAEVLELIYVQRLSMKETAERLKFSTSTCHRMRSKAFACIDAIGIDAAIAGEDFGKVDTL